jgi:hypothetical protein
LAAKFENRLGAGRALAGEPPGNTMDAGKEQIPPVTAVVIVQDFQLR